VSGLKVIAASSIAVLALLATARLAAGTSVGPAAASGEGELQVLGGEMVYFADAATFLECMTGRSYPIAMEGDYLALERAYSAAAEPPGSPLYVTLQGVLADRARMEGEGTERAVVVRRFINAWPGQRCERAASHASLANTYWRLVRLRGEPVRAEEGEREPHLVLQDLEGWREYVAVTGCRRLAGPYSIDGGEIEFGPPTAAPVSCPPSLAALERSLTNALAAVTRWRIHAQTLELYDESGASVALLEAVYLR
jgi:heat shock protein HslJ